MKLIDIIGVLLLVGASFALPLDQNGIEDVPLKEITREQQKSRWVMVPDADGKMYLVDLDNHVEDITSLWNADQDVFFMLYTQRNPTTGQRITLDANGIRDSYFNVGALTRFVIHGWNNDHQSTVNSLIRSAYLGRGDFNVIVVDWGAGANTIDYITASYRAKDVGIFVAKMVDYMNEHGLIDFGNLLITGHSLGGHAAGISGKFVARGKVKTIIGLDPAGPLYTDGNDAERIAPGDADYVEIIHTNGWNLGFGNPIGQSDFYPNYGYAQPGCGIDLTGSCAHSRAYEFFAESINNNNFVARGCTDAQDIRYGSCIPNGASARMGGEPPNSGVTGYFLLETNSASPFSRG